MLSNVLVFFTYQAKMFSIAPRFAPFRFWSRWDDISHWFSCCSPHLPVLYPHIPEFPSSNKRNKRQNKIVEKLEKHTYRLLCFQHSFKKNSDRRWNNGCKRYLGMKQSNPRRSTNNFHMKLIVNGRRVKHECKFLIPSRVPVFLHRLFQFQTKWSD